MRPATALRIFGAVVVVLLCTATAVLAVQFSAGLGALARISSNNLAFVGSSAVVEMLRVRAALSNETDGTELRLRADIFASRARLLSEGEFRVFASLQEGGDELVAELLDLSGRIQDAVATGVQPPGLRDELRRMERPLMHLASRANQAGGERIGQKREQLQDFFTQLVAVAGISIVLVVVLLTRFLLDQRLLVRKNRELRRAKDKYHDLAHRDHLTGIANRASFLCEVEARDRPTIAIIDLDGFKAVNDRCGHAAGDAVLAEVSRRMVEVVGERGLVARIGGDEFAILSFMDEQSFPALVDRAAEAVRMPFRTASGVATIGASVGIARRREDEDVLALVARADMQMYRMKNARRRPPTARGANAA